MRRGSASPATGSTCGPGRRRTAFEVLAACALALAMLASTPMLASITTSAVPPNESSGSGTPVIGMSPVTAPRLMMVCRPIHPVMPAAIRRPNVSGAAIAMRMPANSSTANIASTKSAPSRPSSSPTIAKMKSECALGR